MNVKFLKVDMEISVTTGELESFMKDIRLTMSDDEKNWVSEARQHAETVTNCALSMLGESLGRASAYSKNPMKSEVFIDLESKTVSGCLYHELIKAADNHFGWSPELIAHIKADSKDFQQRLSERCITSRGNTMLAMSAKKVKTMVSSVGIKAAGNRDCGNRRAV